MHKPLNPLLDTHLGVIAQQAACLADIGVGDRYISGLFGEFLDIGLFTENPFSMRDEFAQGDGLRLPEVEDCVPFQIPHRPHDPINDVINVGIIPA